MKGSLTIILIFIGVLVGVFFAANQLGYVDNETITGFATNPKPEMCAEGTLDDRKHTTPGTNFDEIWIEACYDERYDERITDNPKGCRQVIEDKICTNQRTCCWSVCSAGSFMVAQEADGTFQGTRKQKEPKFQNVLRNADITFNRPERGDNPCSYNVHSYVNGQLCDNDNAGCFTCVGGMTKQTMFVVTQLGHSIGGFQLTGGSEFYTDKNKIIVNAHEDGSNHYTGEAFDTTSKQRIDTFLEQKQYSDDKGFFDNYGFTKDSIVCNWEDLPERPGKPSRDHYHCVIDQTEVDKILNCNINRYNIQG